MEFVAVDILNDDRGIEQLLQLGVRTVPIVAKDGQFVFGHNLDVVAAFVGVPGTGHRPLPPDILIERWINVLRAGQRYVRQIGTELMNERALETRDRTIRVLSLHVFRIAEAFLECAADGVEYTIGIADLEPPAGTFMTGTEIAAYGDDVVERLKAWGTTGADRSCGEMVQTFYGAQSVHDLLERSTWHSAQHAKQLMYILQRYGIDPDGPLVEGDWAGLPLPNALF